jgi:predicted aspartyl protease
MLVHMRGRRKGSTSPLWELVGIVGVMDAGCAQFAPEETVIAPSAVQLDIEFIRDPLSPVGIPIIAHRASGQGEALFAIDTGSQGTILSEEFAAQANCRPRCTLPYSVVDANGDRTESIEVVRIDKLRFEAAKGDVVFHEFDAIVARTPLFKCGIAGILGAPVFSQCTFTINFAEKTLQLTSEELDREMPYAVPIRVSSGLIYLPIELMGERHWALLDTGSSGFLGVPEEAWTSLPTKEWLHDGGAQGITFGRGFVSKFSQLDGAVLIAGQKISNPFVTSHRRGEFIVGSGMLQNLVLSVDQRSQVARLVEATREAPSGSRED